MTLAVLDLHCATNAFPELCKLGISQPSGLLAAFRSAHEELEFSTIPFVYGPEVLAALCSGGWRPRVAVR